MPTIINDVKVHPQTVWSGEKYTITVTAESIFRFSDLSKLTWREVEDRGLRWSDIDDSDERSWNG